VKDSENLKPEGSLLRFRELFEYPFHPEPRPPIPQPRAYRSRSTT
jgi:hypothetical protein